MAESDCRIPCGLPRLENFIFTEKLGEGTYASVYKAYRRGDRREVVAIKCIKRTSLNKRSTEFLMTEIELLKQLKHQHIVELYDFEWNLEAIYLIMEYCSGGDLSQFIRSRKALPEKVARKFLRQLAMALKFLRERNISHMDLKPQNLLLSSLHDPVLKVGDFGFAQCLQAAKDSTDLRGSPLYMAPEMFVSDQYTCLVDLCTAAVDTEALYGQAPFASSSWAELQEKITDEKPIELPDMPLVSTKCRELLIGLLKRDPNERMTFTAFFDHPFIDLEHIPSPDSLSKACALVTKAVQKDSEGDLPYAAQLYCAALDYFLPAVHYESDEKRKVALREKVKQYIDRAEQLKNVMKKATRDPNTRVAPLESAIQKHERLRTSVNKIRDAERADDREEFELSLQLYEEGLEGAIAALSSLRNEEQEALRAEVEQWLKRAEEIKLYLEIKSSKQEADFETDKSSVKAKECVIQ